MAERGVMEDAEERGVMEDAAERGVMEDAEEAKGEVHGREAMLPQSHQRH